MNRIRSGTAIVPTMRATWPPDGWVKLLPTPSIVAIASSMPRSIEPASPMKILAG